MTVLSEGSIRSRGVFFSPRTRLASHWTLRKMGLQLVGALQVHCSFVDSCLAPQCIVIRVLLGLISLHGSLPSLAALTTTSARDGSSWNQQSHWKNTTLQWPTIDSNSFEGPTICTSRFLNVCLPFALFWISFRTSHLFSPSLVIATWHLMIRFVFSKILHRRWTTFPKKNSSFHTFSRECLSCYDLCLQIRQKYLLLKRNKNIRY